MPPKKGGIFILPLHLWEIQWEDKDGDPLRGSQMYYLKRSFSASGFICEMLTLLLLQVV